MFETIMTTLSLRHKTDIGHNMWTFAAFHKLV